MTIKYSPLDPKRREIRLLTINACVDISSTAGYNEAIFIGNEISTRVVFVDRQPFRTQKNMVDAILAEFYHQFLFCKGKKTNSDTITVYETQQAVSNQELRNFQTHTFPVWIDASIYRKSSFVYIHLRDSGVGRESHVLRKFPTLFNRDADDGQRVWEETIALFPSLGSPEPGPYKNILRSIKVQNRGATDARDHVYGFWGLFNAKCDAAARFLNTQVDILLKDGLPKSSKELSTAERKAKARLPNAKLSFVTVPWHARALYNTVHFKIEREVMEAYSPYVDSIEQLPRAAGRFATCAVACCALTQIGSPLLFSSGRSREWFEITVGIQDESLGAKTEAYLVYGEGRRYAITDKAEFTLVPGHAEVRDVICVLLGCGIPIVLRELQDENGEDEPTQDSGQDTSSNELITEDPLNGNSSNHDLNLKTSNNVSTEIFILLTLAAAILAAISPDSELLFYRLFFGRLVLFRSKRSSSGEVLSDEDFNIEENGDENIGIKDSDDEYLDRKNKNCQYEDSIHETSTHLPPETTNPTTRYEVIGEWFVESVMRGDSIKAQDRGEYILESFALQ
ncbi:hypothetical protein G7Y89_g5116 [Cudoniella acicularis]|uniref:Uncharacterized protein n=1 Tax=Cudoniella acicularis TaxID=354080 RepID=A0A8H4RNW9_9HELO|nr:hypothetical protein G7Y89_g5116 [Cudoniella acicularis]